jgi:hypothetical protein
MDELLLLYVLSWSRETACFELSWMLVLLCIAEDVFCCADELLEPGARTSRGRFIGGIKRGAIAAAADGVNADAAAAAAAAAAGEQ